jgi:hypothetical protein
MAIVLNGTTGITTPDITSSGSLNIDASAPDNSLVVTSAGNVGIGTSSPRDVAGYVSLGLNDTTGGLLDFYANGTRVGGIVGVSGSLQIGTATATPLIFNTDTNERARIDSSGRTLIGITASRPNGGVLQVSAQGQTGLVTYTTSTASNNAAYFENGNGIVGTIATNGSSTSYNTSSDYRLKEDWVAVADASTRVNALKPVNFAWIASGERVDGFLAHELGRLNSTSKCIGGSVSNIAIQGGATGTAVFTIESPTTNTNRTLTLPDEAGTIDTLQRAGNVLQVVNVQTGAVATGTTTIAFDDTVPQSSEGTEFITLAITPTSSTSKLRIDFSVVLNHTVGTVRLQRHQAKT